MFSRAVAGYHKDGLLAPRQARLGWMCLTLDFVEVGG